MCEKDIKVNYINGPYLYTIYQFGFQLFNSVNLVPNLSIPCHFGPCHYPLDGKVFFFFLRNWMEKFDVSNGITKN